MWMGKAIGCPDKEIKTDTEAVVVLVYGFVGDFRIDCYSFYSSGLGIMILWVITPSGNWGSEIEYAGMQADLFKDKVG